MVGTLADPQTSPKRPFFFRFGRSRCPRRPQSWNPMCFLVFNGVAVAGADCFDFVGWSLGCSVDGLCPLRACLCTIGFV